MNANSKYDANITLSEWIDIYLQTYRTNVNPLYIKTDDVCYNRLKLDLGTRRLNDILEIDLQKSLNALTGKSFSYATKYKQTIQRVFKKALKNRIITFDPSDDLQLPQTTKGTHRALTTAEIALITQHYHEAGSSGLWMMLMLFAGLRRSEMIALDWSSVDMLNRTITIKQVGVIQSNAVIVEQRTKSAAGLRILPIPTPLYNALNAIPPQHRNGFVCLNQHNKPLTETSIKRGLDHFCDIMTRIINNEPLSQSGRRTDLNPPTYENTFSFRLHDLRHTYCTMLFVSGVDVKTAAYLMGHSDVSVTMRIYTHLTAERKSESTVELMSYIDNLIADKNALGSKMVVKNPDNSDKNPFQPT